MSSPGDAGTSDPERAPSVGAPDTIAGSLGPAVVN